jgi:hypothetical protein
VRKRHSEDTWLAPSAILILALVTIGAAFLAFQALDGSRGSAAVEAEVLRACELVDQFQSNMNRFPINLDEVEFSSEGLIVLYSYNELSAHILADGPDDTRYECSVPRSVGR